MISPTLQCRPEHCLLFTVSQWELPSGLTIINLLLKHTERPSALYKKDTSKNVWKTPEGMHLEVNKIRCEIMWNTNLMQRGNVIGVYLARHVSGTYAHHQEH